MNNALKRLPFLAAMFAIPLLGACAERAVVSNAPLTVLATDGPPLAVVGEYEARPLSGSMDRTGMVGYGHIALRAEGDGPVFACEADIDEPPTEKGRVRGLLRCSNGRVLPFSLRNTGPDQGAGIAREKDGGDLMVFFYHPCKDEARLRFPSVKADIALARSAGKR